MIPFHELKAFLDAKHEAFNRPSFIADDPISIPHAYSQKEDVEIAGLLAATLAWGRRDLIVRSGARLCALMGNSPYDFVMEADAEALGRLEGFVYRTFQAVDARGFMLGLRNIYMAHGGLEAVMRLAPSDTDTAPAINRLRAAMIATPGFATRTRKHIASPADGSSAKRLNMYLRWMVRCDGRGVDLGIWHNMQPSQLICPLDVHTGNTARKLGLLSRTQDDWKASLELTDALRRFDPQDPVRYDFSLFGLGVFEKF